MGAVSPRSLSRVGSPGALETLIVERRDGVVTVTMHRPAKKNAANETMWAELRATFEDVAGRAEDRVLVLTGAGGDFCSGADLSGRGGPGEAARGPGAGRTVDDGTTRDATPLGRMRRVNAACIALHRIPQPTIAKVRGVAVGAGCNLALGCDLVVASEGARLSEIFARRGLSLDFGGSWVLPRRVGLHRANELAFLADLVGAADAAAMGLVNRVVPDAELDAFVDGWARRLAAGPPIALAATKRLLQASLASSLEEALEAEAAAQVTNFGTADTAEAMAAFLEKRDPKFTGR
ncbi:MAG: hypothetical protein RL283_1050 [Actinomycetota bacterium]|jgi:2-(1,2-epoxy-1,2-dihydrophenyl)acetyl-CoA isomerase